ncbi:MAG: hypothetical protein LIQ30_11455 [Planctomycetes bacterium]|nr:hypothetical protein [Planctomycetota bacterium]
MTTTDHDWRSRLRELYTALDRDIAERSLVCDGCGGCCRFDTVDHLLYASRLERDYLIATAGPPPEPDDASVAALIADGLRCPYQVEGKCLARDGRVLGCRLHFCRWPDGGDEDSFQERWHRELKSLHDDCGMDWRYARLLPLALDETFS